MVQLWRKTFCYRNCMWVRAGSGRVRVRVWDHFIGLLGTEKPFVYCIILWGHIALLKVTTDFLACYERKCSAAAPFVYCIILLGHIAIPKTVIKKNGNKNRKGCSVWQKTLAFAHIATTCLNIT